MPEETILTLINAGVAGVFAVFAIVLMREVIKFIGEQNQSWRAFLEDERKQRAVIMVTSQDAMNKLTGQITELSTQTANIGVQTANMSAQIANMSSIIQKQTNSFDRGRRTKPTP